MSDRERLAVVAKSPDRTEGRPVTVVKRVENPIVFPLHQEPAFFKRFGEIVNDWVFANGGLPIDTLHTRDYHNPRFNNEKIPFTIIPIAYSDATVQTEEGLRRLLAVVNQVDTLNEKSDAEGDLKQNVIHAMFAGVGREGGDEGEEASSVKNGFYFLGKEKGPGGLKIPAEGVLEMRYSVYRDDSHTSESSLAYQAVISSLVLANRLDLSTPEGLAESLPLRRKIFTGMYRDMLIEIMPLASRNEIFNLESQIDDINTNLYYPLAKGAGHPMNTLLVGAPGVGKSLVGRYFASTPDVLTVPLSIDLIGHGNFEHYILPQLTQVKNHFETPIVVLMDDIEAILESGISYDGSGARTQFVDPARRAQSLTLLERMQDTYGIYLLCTLNHPDVETAFLRRFNPVYFSLPTDEQRTYVIGKVILQGPLSDEEYQSTVVRRLQGDTTGFNYTGITLMGDYIANSLLRNGNDSDVSTYRDALNQAFTKAKERTDIDRLGRFDKAAKKMVGLPA